MLIVSLFPGSLLSSGTERWEERGVQLLCKVFSGVMCLSCFLLWQQGTEEGRELQC